MNLLAACSLPARGVKIPASLLQRAHQMIRQLGFLV